MSSIWDSIFCFLKDRKIDLVDDLLLPSLALDKIVTLIGLIYVIRTFSNSYKLNRVNFIYQLTQSHRDIWSKIYQNKLDKILDKNADISSLSKEERRHIIFIILNTKISFEAHKTKVYPISKQAQLDIGDFFNLPFPNLVFEDLKLFYEKDFVSFINACKKKAANKSEPKFILVVYRKAKETIVIFYNYCSNKVKAIREVLSIRKFWSSSSSDSPEDPPVLDEDQGI